MIPGGYQMLEGKGLEFIRLLVRHLRLLMFDLDLLLLSMHDKTLFTFSFIFSYTLYYITFYFWFIYQWRVVICVCLYFCGGSPTGVCIPLDVHNGSPGGTWRLIYICIYGIPNKYVLVFLFVDKFIFLVSKCYICCLYWYISKKKG